MEKASIVSNDMWHHIFSTWNQDHIGLLGPDYALLLDYLLLNILCLHMYLEHKQVIKCIHTMVKTNMKVVG
jgi:hypothetical protein